MAYGIRARDMLGIILGAGDPFVKEVDSVLSHIKEVLEGSFSSNEAVKELSIASRKIHGIRIVQPPLYRCKVRPDISSICDIKPLGERDIPRTNQRRRIPRR